MSESTSISAEIRDNNISAKILRKSGEIPAIVYGQENDPKLVKILEKDLVKILAVSYTHLTLPTKRIV